MKYSTAVAAPRRTSGGKCPKCHRPGWVLPAAGGTLFIDEVAEMDPGLQAKFLRVLEDKCYRRVGGTARPTSPHTLAAVSLICRAVRPPLEVPP